MGVTVFWSTVGRYSSSATVTMMFTYLRDQTCLSINTDKATMKPAVWGYLHGADWKDWSLQMYLAQQKWCARHCVQLFRGVPICSEIICQSLEAVEFTANFGHKDVQKSTSLVYPSSFPSNEPIMTNRMLVLERWGYDKWKEVLLQRRVWCVYKKELQFQNVTTNVDGEEEKNEIAFKEHRI